MAFARDVYTAGAAQTDYTLTFPYQEEEDVTVSVNGTLKTVTTDYTFFSATVIRLVVASTAGDTVVLQRSTSQSTRDVTFVAGTLTAADLNNSAIQMFYLAQESLDIAGIKLGKDTAEIWDATSIRIQNVGTPTATGDAVTKSYVDTLAITGTAGTPVAVADGGTGSATAAAARTALGLYSTTEVDALVDDLSGVTDASTARTNLGLVIGTDVQADLAVPSQAEAEAGTATTERVFTAQRVGQAIADLSPFGKLFHVRDEKTAGTLGGGSTAGTNHTRTLNTEQTTDIPGCGLVFTLAYGSQTVNFTVGATLTGGTSGATATIVADADGGSTGTLKLVRITGTFQNPETITDSSGGSATTTGTIASPNTEVYLPAGTYYISATAPGYSCNEHHTKVWNASDSANLLIGRSSGTQNFIMNWSLADGNVVLAAGKLVTVRHWVNSARASDGLGDKADSAEIEVYTDFKAWKVA